MVKEAPSDSLELSPEGPSLSQEETALIFNKNKPEPPSKHQMVKEDKNADLVNLKAPAKLSLESKSEIVSPTQKQKETPSIFKKRKDQLVKDVREKIGKNEVFTEVELQDAWKDFIEFRKNKVESEMEQLILTRQIIKKGTNALIKLNSSLEIAIFDRIEVDLVNFLREALSNDQLIVNKEIKEDPKKDKLYTSKDKYDFMVKEQPLLQKLKDKLGLDFEY